MVRVLYVSHSSQLYGAEQSLLQLLKGLDRDRFSPVVVLPQEGPLKQQIAGLAIPVEVVPSMRPWLTRRSGALRLLHHIGLLPFLAWSLWMLMKLIRRYQVDLVHTNSLVIIDGALAARLSGLPHVWHAREILADASPHNFLFGRFGIRVAIALVNRLSDRIIAISNAVRCSLAEAGNEAKSVTIYNAVELGDASTCTRNQVLRRELGVPDEVFLVGEVAQLTPIKGYEDFIAAAAQVHRVLPNTRFIAVGGALNESFERRVKDLIASLEMESSFTLLGFRQDAAEIIEGLDLLVLPSHYEPFGRVLVEAMAAGKPVVGAHVGGIPEIVEDGVTGLLVPPHSPEKLAHAISKILQDPDLACRLGAAGRARAKACFSQERYVAEIQKIYGELQGEGAPLATDSFPNQLLDKNKGVEEC